MFKENLKRHWGFMAISFLMYFLIGPYSIIVKSNELTGSLVQRALSTNYYSILLIIASVIASTVVFSFLNKQNSVTAVHLLPLSRKDIFVQNYTSGLVLLVAPLVLNAVCLFLVKRPVYADMYIDVLGNNAPQNIFTAGAIINWLFSCIVIVCFTYSIAVLASCICGNTAIQVITAFVLNAIVPVLLYTLDAWGCCFLYGYSSSNFISSFACLAHPALYSVAGDWIAIPIYLIIAAGISYCAFLFYKNRKLERAGDSYVFSFVKWIAGFMFVYFPAVYIALLFTDVLNPYSALAIGGIVGFAIGAVIINKSFRIFNKDVLKHLVVYAAIMVLFAAFFSLDVAGFEKRIPKEEKIESAYLYGYGNYDYETGYSTYLSTEDIDLITEVHEICIENKTEAENYNESDIYDIWISYYTKSGGHIQRCYEIPAELLSEDLLSLLQREDNLNDFLNL